MEVDHHKSVHLHHLHIKWAEKEEENKLVLLSQRWQRQQKWGGRRVEAGEAGTLSVTLWKYIIISVFFAFSFL